MFNLTGRQLIKILRENGFVESRRRGSHIIFCQPVSGVVVPVPIHGANRPIPVGTLMAIIKQSKLAKDKFKKS